MAFSVKDWHDLPIQDTPLSAAAMEDLETRLSGYTDTVAAGGIELGYAAITSDFTSATVGTFQDVTGFSITVTVGSRPIMLRAFCEGIQHTASNGNVLMQLMEGSTGLNFAQYAIPSVNWIQTALLEVRLTPSAGSHTYKMQWGSNTAGTHKILAASGSYQAFIQAIQI